jgi:hypothetical protein
VTGSGPVGYEAGGEAQGHCQPAAVFPTLCFAERPVGPEEGLGCITRLHAPSEFFAFHEYVTGGIVACFDEGAEAVDEIERGCL